MKNWNNKESMDPFKNKTKYIKHLEYKYRNASSLLSNLRGKKITSYEDISILSNADGYSLSAVKQILSTKCFEHIAAYELDLNIRDVRMLQIAYNSVEKYWYSGFFTGTDYNRYKDKIKEFKKYAYATIGLDYNNCKKIIEVPILPHVMQGLLRRYYVKINMPEETIKTILRIFEGERIPKMNHKQIHEIEILCNNLAKEFKSKKIDAFSITENELYDLTINHFGQDYFITKDPNRSRWKEWK